MSERQSVWSATADRPAHAQLDGDLEVDVAVVGGGITGLTTALLLLRDGARVAVLEADRIGSGTTGGTTGKVTSQHGLAYASLVERHGEDRARLYAEANQRAIETVAELAEATGGDCGFRRAPSFVYTTDPGQRDGLQAEYLATERLGLPASLTTDVDLPFPVELALRFEGQAHLHPLRYLVGLARMIEEAGGLVFEGTRAVGVDERPDHAVVETASGNVEAEHVVVATLLPFLDRGGFFAKARASRAYGVAARLAGPAPEGMHLDPGPPTRSTRPWDEGGRPGLIVVGENHLTGGPEAAPGRWGELERWARDHFPIASFEYRWSAQDYLTVDDVPYVGRSPRSVHTFVATGFRKWGLTNGTAAAQVLADLLAGRDNPWLPLFDATRVGDASAIGKAVQENLDVAQRFVGDRIGRLSAHSVAHLAPGTGGIVEVEGRTVAAYRGADGEVQAVSATCTHLGCTVHWNAAEVSWDCPCHGSRFGLDGRVLDAPAVAPLERVEVDPEPHGER